MRKIADRKKILICAIAFLILLLGGLAVCQTLRQKQEMNEQNTVQVSDTKKETDEIKQDKADVSSAIEDTSENGMGQNSTSDVEENQGESFAGSSGSDSISISGGGTTGTGLGSISDGSSGATVGSSTGSASGEESKDVSTSSSNVCTISISCATILDNMEKLKSGKEAFVPADGWILRKTTVEFSEGDTVYDALVDICKKKKIHMEHTYTPIYGSEYIEGIQQIYEYDCGELSGWTYRVNGKAPNYGCDKYVLKEGDEIEWLYTCNLGKDL